MTSGVSALSGRVANGHRAVRHVSSVPSKIPYGGFSPVRLQTGSVRRHLRRLRRFISGQLRRVPPGLVIPRCVGRGAGTPAHSGPEALGSASGYAVPSRRRLLWPHPSSWCPSGGLMVFARAGLCLLGRGPGGPCFHLRILPSVPPSVPRQTGRPRTIRRPPVLAFARMRGARRLRVPT